jgi:nicotinamide-nucleotide amidase
LTGVAGPASQEGVKPGTLFVGVCLPDGTTASTTFALPAVRDQMRQLSVISALDFLRRHIREL